MSDKAKQLLQIRMTLATWPLTYRRRLYNEACLRNLAAEIIGSGL